MTANASSAEMKASPWWVTLIGGIAAIIVGLLLFTSPAKTTVFLIQTLGVYWLITGMMSIVSMFIDHTAWGWKLFSGILGIIVGILILQSPLWATVIVPTTLVWILGLQGIVVGIVGLFQAFRGAGWGAGILGIVSIVFGIYLMGNALAGAVALVWVAAIVGVVGGFYLIYLAFKQRKAGA